MPRSCRKKIKYDNRSLPAASIVVLATAAVATGVSIATGSAWPAAFWALLTALFWTDGMLNRRR